MTIFSYIISTDLWIENMIFSVRTIPLDHFFMFVTMIGNWQVITGLLLLLVLLFLNFKKGSLIFPFLISVMGSGLLTVVIKYLVGRSRPSGNIPLYTESLSSFPSAHAALIFSLFGFLIYCVWVFKYRLITKIFLTLIFLLTIGLVGFSRLYLGVHFLSDVIAGYLVGLLWVFTAMYLFSQKILTNHRF